MATKIRLSRGGAKKRPYYRVVVADARSPRDGRFIERVGSYNPLLPKDDPNRIKLNEERIRFWLDRGARPTDRVARFLGTAEIIPMPPQRHNPQKAKPKAKAMERAKAQAESTADTNSKEKGEPDQNSDSADTTLETTTTENSPAENTPEHADSSDNTSEKNDEPTGTDV